MNRLKKLLLFTSLLLFVVLLINILGYIKRESLTLEKESIEEAYYLSTNQQLLIPQLSKKILLITTHNYLSKGQFQQQFNEIFTLKARISRQQRKLRFFFRSISLPDNHEEKFLSYFDTLDRAVNEMLKLVDMNRKNNLFGSDTSKTQQILHTLELSSLSYAEQVNNLLQVRKKIVAHSISSLGQAMFTSLVVGLLLLIGLLMLPAIRLNTITYRQLAKSLEKTKQSQTLLQESERKYRQLFEFTPMPAWIFEIKTFRILEVNQQMIEHYGYSKEELINSMTALDIRPTWEHLRFINNFSDVNPDHPYKAGKWIHQKRGGETFTVETYIHPIQYQDKECVMVLANNITKNLQLQKELLETKIQHQRELGKITLAVQEKERNEIGRELHDNVNQILTSVKLQLEYAVGRLNEVQIHKAIGGISTAIQEIRRLSGSLVPSSLGDVGLIHAIQDLVDNANLCCKGHFEFIHFDLEEEGLETDFKLTLFRIIQEQITNVIKHAEASEILIKLERESNELQLIICDNGMGFEKKAKRKGIGIHNIISRADMFLGNVLIESEPGAGCRLEVRFLLQHVAAIV